MVGITYGDLSSLFASTRFGIWGLSRLDWCEIFVCVVSFPRTTRFACLCGDSEMSNVTDTGKGFATESVGAD